MKTFLILKHKIKVLISIANYWIGIVIGGIVFLPVIAISPFLKIRVGELESRLIGHFSLTIELYLSDLDIGVVQKDKKSLDILFFNKKISNRFLAAKWSQVFKIYPRFPWSQLHNFLISTGVARSHLIPLRHWKKSTNWQIDIYHSLSKVNPHINFSKEEMEESEKILDQLGINRINPIICFHIRNSLFHNNPIYNLNKSGPRDSSIKIFEKSMEQLAKKQINIVRVGRKMPQPIKSSINGVVDYSFSVHQKDIIDIYLMHKSEFIVGTLSGMENVGLMFRKPVCAVNVSEWRVLDNFNLDQIPIFLPKKFLWKNTALPLTLNEIISTGAYEFNWNIQFENAGIIYVDNSEDDIVDAVNQMLMYSKNKNDYLDLSYQDVLINDFLAALPPRNGWKITSRLPLNYLQNNPHLLM